jgi:hypothetical protein
MSSKMTFFPSISQKSVFAIVLREPTRGLPYVFIEGVFTSLYCPPANEISFDFPIMSSKMDLFAVES